jgi:hypothetical protein
LRAPSLLTLIAKIPIINRALNLLSVMAISCPSWKETFFG